MVVGNIQILLFPTFVIDSSVILNNLFISVFDWMDDMQILIKTWILEKREEEEEKEKESISLLLTFLCSVTPLMTE